MGKNDAPLMIALFISPNTRKKEYRTATTASDTLRMVLFTIMDEVSFDCSFNISVFSLVLLQFRKNTPHLRSLEPVVVVLEQKLPIPSLIVLVECCCYCKMIYVFSHVILFILSFYEH